MALRIPATLWRQLREHGEQTYPGECCGVLLGQTAADGVRQVSAIRPCRNTRTDSPQDRYHIDPGELMRIQRQAAAENLDILGFYHSHPDCPAQWSATDLAEAHWTGCSYVITSVRDGRACETNSFALSGGETTKTFLDEEIQLVPAEASDSSAEADNVMQ